MILHDKTPDGRDILQGEPEWFAVRMGIPTASQFHRILTPTKEKLAEGRWSYAFELAGERLLQESKEEISGLEWMERGKMLESDAVQHFEFVTRLKTAKAAFVTTDDGRWGCSPDRLVFDDSVSHVAMEAARRSVGGLEIKAPSPAKHLQYFAEGPGTDYRCQVQGSLLVTGFEHWSFKSYHPHLPQVLIRFERDEPFIEKLRKALDQFCDEVEAVVEKVKEAGYVPPPGRFTSPVDAYARQFNAEARIINEQNWGG